MNHFFEEKLQNDNVNYSLLNAAVKDKAQAGDYYAKIRDGYKKYFDATDALTKGKFSIRYYRGKKLIYSSAQMLMEAKEAFKNECIVAYYFLMYYALFQSMQANLIICKDISDEKVIQLSHESVKNQFESLFCNNSKCPVNNDIIQLIEHLRKCREYFSYAMPFNIPDEAIINYNEVEKWIKVCIQLFNLHCSIIKKEVTSTISIDMEISALVKAYFIESCNRLGNNDFSDEADKDFWLDVIKYGSVDLCPLNISFMHDFDEYGGYDGLVYEKMGMPRKQKIINNTLSFIYKTIE